MSKIKLSLKLSGRKNIATVYVAIDGWVVGFHQDKAELMLEPGAHMISFEIGGEPGGSVKITLSSGGETVLGMTPKIPSGEYGFSDFEDFSL